MACAFVGQGFFLKKYDNCFKMAACVVMFLASFTQPMHAETKILSGPILAKTLEIVDGDTLTVRALIWLGNEVETKVRILGIDAPELKGKCPLERRKAVEAREALARLVDHQAVQLSDIRSDKYGGRVLAHVKNAKGQDLGEALKSVGLARPYDGGKRSGWCG